VDVKNTKSLNEDIAKGLVYARMLKMEIVKLGLLKIFEPPIQPPFMLDPTIDQIEEPTVKHEVKSQSATPPPSTTNIKHQNRTAVKHKIMRL